MLLFISFRKTSKTAVKEENKSQPVQSSIASKYVSLN